MIHTKHTKIKSEEEGRARGTNKQSNQEIKANQTRHKRSHKEGEGDNKAQTANEQSHEKGGEERRGEDWV